MRLFAVGLGIAGWLCSGIQSLSPVMAQGNTNPPTCKVAPSAPVSMLTTSLRTSFGNMPQALQTDANSYFEISCTGNRSGSLTLSIIPSNTNRNGIAQFRASANSTFTNIGYTQGTSTISFSVTGNKTEKVYYQVLVDAPRGQVLESATTYAVTINATLNLN